MKSSIIIAVNLKSVFRNVCLASLLVISFSITASAQKATDSSGASIASVIYQGTENDKLVFCMKYENASGDKFSVSVKDAGGFVLYNEAFSDKKFSRTFKIPADAADVTFIIGNAKGKQEKKFTASIKNRVTENISVTKL